MASKQNLMIPVIILALGILAVLLILIFKYKDLNGISAFLLNIILTLFSLFCGYLMSQSTYRDAVFEVKQQQQDYYKTYVRNASERVKTNSKELNRLYTDLNDFIAQIESIGKKEKDGDIRFTAHSLKEKIKSTINILKTIKSVNDNFLNDWEGVVPPINPDTESINGQLKNISETVKC